MTTITRQQLRDAAEEAIGRPERLMTDEPLTDEQKALLRHTAETATKIARGDWTVGSCGCLVQQAGLRDANGNSPGSVAMVGVGFDISTRLALNVSGPMVLTVVD